MREEILGKFKKCASKVFDKIDSDAFKRGKKMGEGADGTPTKLIDQVAEETALDHLLENTDFSVLSEEAGLVEQEGDGYVIMDPIDGTNNSILGIPFYSISLAYTPVDLSEVEVGYVKNFATGDEYYAIEGEGAFKNGTSIEPIKKTSDNTFCIYLGKYALPKSGEIASRATRVRSLGSAALSMCMVAEGVFDLFYHRTPEKKKSLRITDLAASTLILREVGGEVYEGEWDILEMGISPDERKDVIAINDEGIKEELS